MFHKERKSFLLSLFGTTNSLTWISSQNKFIGMQLRELIKSKLAVSYAEHKVCGAYKCRQWLKVKELTDGIIRK